MTDAQPPRKIAIRIPRKKLEEEPAAREPPKAPEPAPRQPVKCSICGAELRDSAGSAKIPARAELVYTKTSSGELLWVVKICCAAHEEELFPSVSGKVICSVCGKIALRGKHQPIAKSMFRIRDQIGETPVAAWFCSESCAKELESKSSAHRSCWKCHQREFLLAEAISFAGTGKFGSPEEAATQAANRVKKISACGRCHLGSYCSERCQKEDWPEHKRLCGALVRATPLTKHLAGFGPKVCPPVYSLL